MSSTKKSRKNANVTIQIPESAAAPAPKSISDVTYVDFTEDRKSIGSVEQSEEEYLRTKAVYAASVKAALIERNVSLRVVSRTPKQHYDTFLLSEIHQHNVVIAPVDVHTAKERFEALPRTLGGTEFPSARALINNSYLDEMSTLGNLESTIQRHGLLRSPTNKCKNLCRLIDIVKEDAAIRFYTLYHEKTELMLVFALDAVDRLFAGFVMSGAKNRSEGSMFQESAISRKTTASSVLTIRYYFLFTCECENPQDVTPL